MPDTPIPDGGSARREPRAQAAADFTYGGWDLPSSDVTGARHWEADGSSGRSRARDTDWRGTLSMAVRLWGMAFACLIPLLVVVMLALWIARHYTAQPFQLREALMLAIDWSIWGALAPFIVLLVWRIPLNSGRWVRGLSTHLLIAGVLSLGELALFVTIAKLIGGYQQMTFAEAYWRLISLWYPYALLVYWVIAVAAHSVAVSRRARRREVEAAHLRERLTVAQLDALRMQLHPHFLSNTLNTVAVFLRDGKADEAGGIVTGLGALLHTALDRMDAQEITLREELAFARRYLEIERIRFQDRMHVSVQVDDAALDALVPCMILQPVVENAIRHGISRDARAGRVTIRAARQGERIELAVEDDGPGFGADPYAAGESGPSSQVGRDAATRFRPIYGNGPSHDGHGLGLLNTRLRLDALYGDAARLRVGSRDDGGALVEISLPYHTEPLVSETEPAAATQSRRERARRA